MEGKFIKVDPRKFLNELIPVDVPVQVEKTQNRKGNRKKDTKKTTGKYKQRTQNLRHMFSQLDLTTEEALQQSFINCINENNCFPGFKLIDTKDRPDEYDDTKHGVDACLFRTDDIPQLNLDGSVTAHWQAYKFSKILHRDVSVGNILMVEGHDSESQWEGYLTDWELSMPLGQMGPRQSRRTGTWHFMSALLLTKVPGKELYTLQDDLESFFHVMLYMGVRYLKHNVDCGSFINKFFDDAIYEEGSMMCGICKFASMRSGLILYGSNAFRFLASSSRHFKDVEETQVPGQHDYLEDLGDHPAASDDHTPEDPAELPKPHPLNAILYELLSWFKARYAKHWPRKRLRTRPEVANANPWGTNERRRQIWLTLDEDVEETTPEVHEEPPEDTSLAIKLNSHGPFAMLLLKWIGVEGRLWPTDDKSHEDQLLSGYEYYRPAAYYCSTPRPQKRTLEVETEPGEASPSMRVRSTQASSSKPLPASETSQPLKARRIRGKKRAKRSSPGSTTIAKVSKGKSVAR